MEALITIRRFLTFGGSRLATKVQSFPNDAPERSDSGLPAFPWNTMRLGYGFSSRLQRRELAESIVFRYPVHGRRGLDTQVKHVQKYNFKTSNPVVPWIKLTYICEHSMSLPFYRSLLSIIGWNQLPEQQLIHCFGLRSFLSTRIHPWIQARTRPQLKLTRKRGEGNGREETK